MKRAKKILRMILKTAPLSHFTFEIRTDDSYYVIQIPNQSAIFDLEMVSFKISVPLYGFIR
jgi:hypothetical protein